MTGTATFLVSGLIALLVTLCAITLIIIGDTE